MQYCIRPFSSYFWQSVSVNIYVCRLCNSYNKADDKWEGKRWGRSEYVSIKHWCWVWGTMLIILWESLLANYFSKSHTICPSKCSISFIGLKIIGFRICTKINVDTAGQKNVPPTRPHSIIKWYAPYTCCAVLVSFEWKKGLIAHI